MEPIKIEIKIGGSAATFVALETNAPVDYDAFGMFTFAEIDGTRHVLVREEHVGWHQAHYASLNYWSHPTEFDQRDIEQTLWEALRRQPVTV